MELFNEKVVIANDLHVLGTLYGPTGGPAGGPSDIVHVGYGGTSPIQVVNGASGSTIAIHTTSNAYGTRYVSTGSTPGSNDVGNDGDFWYTVC